jgi:hypothetical protein
MRGTDGGHAARDWGEEAAISFSIAINHSRGARIVARDSMNEARGARNESAGARREFRGRGNETRGAMIESRGAIYLSRGAKIYPRGPKDWTRGSVFVPRGPKECSRGPKDCPRGEKDSPRGPKDWARGAKICSRGAKDWSRDRLWRATSRWIAGNCEMRDRSEAARLSHSERRAWKCSIADLPPEKCGTGSIVRDAAGCRDCSAVNARSANGETFRYCCAVFRHSRISLQNAFLPRFACLPSRRL